MLATLGRQVALRSKQESESKQMRQAEDQKPLSPAVTLHTYYTGQAGWSITASTFEEARQVFDQAKEWATEAGPAFTPVAYPRKGGEEK